MAEKRERQSRLTVNVSTFDLQRMDELVEQHCPLMKRHAVMVAAVKVGLAEFQRNPDRLIEALVRP